MRTVDMVEARDVERERVERARFLYQRQRLLSR